MKRSLQRALLPFLALALALDLAAARLSAQIPGPGDKLPPTVLENLTQTEAKSFSDFHGRAVLLEFFAHWCAPCAASVPHLNELQEQFGPRGFSIVGVTSEPVQKTQPWIAKNRAKYAYGYDTSGALSKLFQVRSIPFAALIDPYGTVVWTGHPGRLDAAEIEKALSGALAQPVWTWPETARPLALLLEKGEYASALKVAAELPPAEGFDFVALVRGRIPPLLARLDGMLERKEHVEAMELGTRLEKELAGLPEAETVATRLAALRADPAVAAEITAATKLADLEKRAMAVRKPSEAEALRAEVETYLKEQAGQKGERRARVLLESIDRALAKAKKNG
jgi:peroxiredoxin